MQFRGRRHHVFDVALSRSKHRTVGADLSANAVFQPLHLRRMYRPFRGQVRSHKIAFLQWVTGCLIRADSSANTVAQPMNIHRVYRPFPGQTERLPVHSHMVCCATALCRECGEPLIGSLSLNAISHTHPIPFADRPQHQCRAVPSVQANFDVLRIRFSSRNSLRQFVIMNWLVHSARL